MKMYMDNAATTQVAPEVAAAIMPFLTENYGNPSSPHLYGSFAKAAIESVRKSIASYINAEQTEIFFTGSGTEGNNMIIKGMVKDLGVRRIISSATEHHCVLHSLDKVGSNGVHIEYVKLDTDGKVDYNDLENLLKKSDVVTLVSLMHANNEIGTLLNLELVSEMCAKYNCYFHTDTVQTIGYHLFDLNKLKIHALTASAHKFHGIKGTGFVYINKELTTGELKLKAFIDGGSQERNMRAGTENVPGIIGMGVAMQLAYDNFDKNKEYISELKNYMITECLNITGISFNGDITETGSNYKVLNISFPENASISLEYFHMEGIAVSGRSACTTGAVEQSHVLKAINANPQRNAVRFSFSKNNTKEEIDYVIGVIKSTI